VVTTETQGHRDDKGASLTAMVIRAAIAVHRALGPGLLENLYEACLCHELKLCGVSHVRQVPLDLEYKGLRVGDAYRMDLVVQSQVVVEVKAVEQLLPVHRAQLLTYLRLSRCSLGLILNFNVPLLRDGIVRMAL
jgi:GxxExxY protein